MKNMNFFFTILIFTIAIGLVSCQNQNNGNPGNTDSANTAMQNSTMNDTTMIMHKFWNPNQDYSYKQKSEFKTEVDSAENSLNNEIDQLQQKASSASADIKTKYQNEIDQLKEQKNHLDMQMKKFSRTTQNNWDKFKSDITSIWSSIDSVRYSAQQNL